MLGITKHPYFYIGIVVLFLAGFPFLVGQSAYYMGLVVMCGIFSIASISLNLLTGCGGQISVGQGGFLIIGAYTVAILSSKFAVPLWLALPAAGAISGFISLIVGLPAVRLRGHFLAVATLGFGLSVPEVALNWTSVTGGYSGMAVMRPDMLSSELTFFYVILFVTIVVTWMISNLVNSSIGRGFLAVRDSEIAAAATGINVSFYKTIMFVVSAFFTGIAGGLYAYWVGYVSPNDFNIMTSFILLAMIVVGGLASIRGAIVGAVLLTLIPHFADAYVGVTSLIIGLAVISVILFRPSGLISVIDLVRTPGAVGETLGQRRNREHALSTEQSEGERSKNLKGVTDVNFK